MEGHEKQKKYDRELEGCMIRKPTAHGINSAQLALYTSPVASFLGPTQLSGAWSREKWERARYLIT